MATYTCPFCNSAIALDKNTNKNYFADFTNFLSYNFYNSSNYQSDYIQIDFYKCPNCNEVSIELRQLSENSKSPFIPVRPNSLARQFPDYVPNQILSDYSEACAIVNLSPKASATLSRRCLQGMIRDFWKVSKKTLSLEIDAIKDNIPPAQWRVIDGVRRIGNIGAHMEKDIDLIVDIEPSEAQKLIKLIELLIEQWYIQRHDQEKLYEDIVDIDEAKQSDRKSTE